MKTYRFISVLIGCTIIFCSHTMAQISPKMRRERRTSTPKSVIATPKLPKTKSISKTNSSDIVIFPTSPDIIQTEFSIASNPLNQNNLLVGGNTDSGQGYYYSLDDGNTWSGNDALPNVSAISSDPSVAFDANGNAFYNYLEEPGTSWKVRVKKSTDGGANWSNFVEIPNAVDPDKNHFTADITNSIYRNYLYVAFTDFISVSGNPIKFSRSTNGGTSFSTPVDISGATTSYFSQGVNLAVGPNGELYAAWAIYDDWSTGVYGEDGIGFNKSTNGGASWQGASRIMNIQGIRGNLTYKNGIRVASFPSMAVDRSGGIWNGTIYVVWADKRYGNPDILLSKSTDGGTTWTTPVIVNDNDLLGNDQWFSWITVNSYGVINIVFYDSKNDPNNLLTETWVAQSSDGGQTFTNFAASDMAFTPYPIPGLLSSDYMGDYIGITSKAGKAYACWMDNSARGSYLYLGYLDIINTSQADQTAATSALSPTATTGNNGRHLAKDINGNYHPGFDSRRIKNNRQRPIKPLATAVFVDSNVLLQIQMSCMSTMVRGSLILSFLRSSFCSVVNSVSW
jgi:hypothetical protein